jgi:sulfate transport system permease protein
VSPPPTDAHVIEATASPRESARPAKPAGARRVPSGALVVGGLSVLIPLAAVVVRSFDDGLGAFWDAITSRQAIAAMRLTLVISLVVAAIDAVMGVLIAWVLVRDEFRGKSVVNGLIDLPFALPTAVAGIALATIYAQQGWVGQFFSFKIAYTPVGVVIALIFVGLPFVVRTLEPIIQDLQKDVEEAAASLGARRLDTAVRVILPALGPAWLTGFAMAFARGVGEYGSVIFIAGNMPYKSEIAPLLIIIQLEEYNYAGAAAIAVVMLALSFFLLFGINAAQAWARRFS